MKNLQPSNFVLGLTVLFIALKLMGYISWNWFFVISPLIFSFSLAIILIFISKKKL